MNAVEYAPGEMVKALLGKKPIYQSPAGMDIAAAVGYMLRDHPGTVRAKVTDFLTMGRVFDPKDGEAVLFVEGREEHTLLFAKFADGQVDIEVCKEGPWQREVDALYAMVRKGKEVEVEYEHQG